MTRHGRFRSLSLHKLNGSGFSYLEILIALMILAVFFLPAMDMFSASVSHLAYISDLNTGLSLAREGMERIRNLRITESQLQARGDSFEPPAQDPPIRLNGSDWRIQQHVRLGTDPLEVDVFVFKNEFMEEPFVEISTLIEDVG